MARMRCLVPVNIYADLRSIFSVFVLFALMSDGAQHSIQYESGVLYSCCCVQYVYGGRESPDSCTRMYVYMTVRKYVLVVSLNLCSDIKTGEEPGFAPYISYRKYSVHPAGWKVLYTQLVIIQVLICTRSAPRTLLPRPIRGRTVRSSRSRCTVRALR